MDSMSTRLSRAKDRAMGAVHGDWHLPLAKDKAPRPDQMGIMRNFAFYLKECGEKLSANKSVPRGRIIVPSRLGKTVLEALMVAATGETATVFVPTLPILERTVAEWQTWLPSVPVGEYHAERKRLVRNGVNVVMYHSGSALFKKDALPPELSLSFFNFFDEGHETMTELRQQMIDTGVQKDAVRIALTATPDYSESRRLATVFPHLIHEMHLGEAIGLNLLAPFIIKHVEVDLDASDVGITHDEFNETDLGLKLSHELMQEGVRRVRSLPEYRHVPTLITCSSVAQVQATLKHLNQFRGPGEPKILAYTRSESPPERARALLMYEAGECDTLVSVRMLLRGWDSPRCKLLIDEAPSLSTVLTKQKLMRPLTRVGLTPGHIVTVYPRYMSARPVMPADVFGRGFDAHPLDIPEVSVPRSGRSTNRQPGTRTRGVAVTITTQQGLNSHDWNLNPQSPAEIKRVIEQHKRFKSSYLPRLVEFCGLTFHTLAFSGTGRELLRYCGTPCGVSEYAGFMIRVLPERAGELFEEKAPSQIKRPKSECLMEMGTWVDGSPDDLEGDEDSIEALVIQDQLRKRMMQGFDAVLTERQMFVLYRRYVMDGKHFEPMRPLTKVAEEMGLKGGERVRQIELEAIRRLRQQAFPHDIMKDVLPWHQQGDLADKELRKYVGLHKDGPIYIRRYTSGYTFLRIGDREVGLYRGLAVWQEEQQWYRQWSWSEETSAEHTGQKEDGQPMIEPF